MAFDTEIKEYEAARQQYQTSIINQMNREEYIKYNEVLFPPIRAPLKATLSP